MALTIETQGNAVLFNGVLTGKEGWVISQSSTRDNISISNKITGISGSGSVEEVEVDGSTYSDFDALVAALGTVLFKTGGGTGEGVQTVNGDTGPAVVLEATDINTQYIIAGETEEGTIQEGMTAYGHQIDGIWNNLNSLPPVASTGSYDDLTDKPTLGTASAADTTDFATAAQGDLADTAVQPSDILDVVRSEQEEGVGTVITNIIAMTQAEYDGLTAPQASTYYVITD